MGRSLDASKPMPRNFMKHVRPPNKGTGLSASQKKEQKNAGLDEHGKAKRAVSPRIHALVVFAETGPYFNRYRVGKLKVENQRDLLAYARRYVAPGSTIITDQHTGYTIFGGDFSKHIPINHSEHFVDDKGVLLPHARGGRRRVARHGPALSRVLRVGVRLAPADGRSR